MKRKQVGTSHEGRYSYWLDHVDLYVYQRREDTKEWAGWLCSEPAWERTFSKWAWITLTEAAC